MTNALVFHPYLVTRSNTAQIAAYALQEMCRLADTLGLNVAENQLIPLKKITPATYIGSGKCLEIAEIAKQHKATLVVMDCALSPGQQKNLEDVFKTKVIDRTGLILEIFGARARTAEGKLQVELAAMEYQKGRLVRAWTHLERQRGGFGFAGGPGETQIELDRRKIRDRIAAIKKDLDKVKNTRALQRKKRQDVPYPVVALVGYTNAGKSTLFNRLTKANVLAEDKLFATLDPTMRAINLPSGRKVMLSDTVGFISHLPTQLVAAFRATLEEVSQANLLLHVRDTTAEDGDIQKQAVLDILKDLDISLHQPSPHEGEGRVGGISLSKNDPSPSPSLKGRGTPILEVMNKMDAATEGDIQPSNSIAISALKNIGIKELLAKIDELV